MTIKPTFDSASVSPAGTLSQILPQRHRSTGRSFGFRFVTQPKEVIVVFDTSEIIVLRTSGNASEELGRLYVSHKGVGEELSSLFLKAGPHGGRTTNVTVRLGTNSVLRRTVQMPKSSSKNLRAAIGFDLERLCPVPPDQVYFDLQPENFDAPGKRVDLLLRLSKRETVDAAVNLCRAAGARVAKLEIEGDSRPLDWRHFPVDRLALASAWWRRCGTVVLGILIFLLSVAALTAAYERRETAIANLQNDIVIAINAASQIEKTRQAVAAEKDQQQFFAAQKKALMTTAIFAELSEILPEGTWLTDIQLRGPKVRIQGYSSAPSDLIGIVETSEHFSDAQFQAPVMRSPGENADRFDLTFQARQ